MNPDKMTPEQMQEFVRAQNYTFKVEFTGEALQAYMADFNDFQQEAAAELLEMSGCKEASEVLARIMAL